MSDTIASLRKKIASASDLQSVVRTMRAVAVSSIGQYEKSVEALGDYYRAVELGLGVCFRQGQLTPLSAELERLPESSTVGAVVFGSDQGLVGQFNDVVADYAAKKLNTMSAKPEVWAVGERIRSRLLDHGLAIQSPVPNKGQALDPNRATGRTFPKKGAPTAQQPEADSDVIIGEDTDEKSSSGKQAMGVQSGQAEAFAVPSSVKAISGLVGQILVATESRYDQSSRFELHLFYNKPISGAAYAPVSQRLLPLDETWQRQLAERVWPTKNLPEVIGDNTATLRALTRSYLFVSLFRACALSLASENASRLAAMQRADTNIDELLTTLNGTFHRQRQSSIDEELFDVIFGFETLSSEGR